MPLPRVAITYPHPTTGAPVYAFVAFATATLRVPVFKAGRVTHIDYVRDREDATGTSTDPIPYRRAA